MHKYRYENIGGWDAIVLESKDGFTVSYAGAGGAIIVAPTHEEAVRKFTEAMSVADSARKLYHFDKHGVFPPSLKK